MKIGKLIIICTLAIATTGCLKVKQTLTINKSGGGNIKLKYAISERAINQLNSMQKLQNQLQKFSGKPISDTEEARYAYMFLMPHAKTWRKELDSYAKFGITVQELKVETRNAWRHVDMKVNFSDLEKLAKTPVFKYIGFELVKNKKGDYVFYRVSEPSKNLKQPDLSNEKVLNNLAPILSGFQVIFILKTPGMVLKTNADRKSTFSSVWSFDFDKDPKTILKLQKSKFITVFSSSGLDLPLINSHNPQVSSD